MTNTAHTPYTTTDSNDVDWYSDDIQAEIAAAAKRHGVSVQRLDAKLQEYIPEGDTPAESIEAAALKVAE